MEAAHRRSSHRSAGGPIVGLTTQLEECFLKQLEARRKNDGRADSDEESRAAPEHLSALISDVLRLDVLREAGATFAYPDALTPVQWAGLEALTNARRRDQEKDFESERQKQTRDDQMAKLRALSHGG